MNRDARECLDTAASLLAEVINQGHCTPSEAAIIVQSIALGTIRWNAETPDA